ncbi:MAG TPA: LamG domain-containing protein [Nitrosopumilaceae archaeon]|nr:LamG domain-containing protein [Nitrosopumilaceae archaeon]
MPQNGLILPSIVTILITIFAVIGGISIANYAYADDGSNSGGTDTSSSSDNSVVLDSSNSESPTSSSSSASEPSTNTDANTGAAISSPPDSSSSSTDSTNNNLATANSDNPDVSSLTTGIINIVPTTIDPGIVSPSNDITDSTITDVFITTHSTVTTSPPDIYNSTTSNSNAKDPTVTYVSVTTKSPNLISTQHFIPIHQPPLLRITTHHLILQHDIKPLTHHTVKTIHNTKVSLQLDSSVGSISKVGHIEVKNIANQISLKLTGQGYLTEHVSSANDLNSFSLSAWVKPDYSKGSPEFAIISKEGAFVLSINNNISPAKIAKFSVFNGIKWITVESTTQIEEKWTHLIATFDGKSISIYINGKLESTLPVEGIPYYANNGMLETKNFKSISSDSNIVVGADLDKLRGQAFRQFSGLIRDLNIDSLPLVPLPIAEFNSKNIM